jgi:hemerythrin superfamily protein
MGRDPFDRLIQDHREILETLDRMEQTPQDSHATRAKLFLKLKRKLSKHAMAEEDIIYPMLNDATHDNSESKALYEDHADIKIRLFEIEQSVKSGNDWSDQVRSLRHLIETHAREEEETEFPKLREALDTQRTRALTSQIHREEALIL